MFRPQPKIKVKEMDQKGKSSFAGELIPKGTVMLETKGKKIPLKDIDSLDPPSLAFNCFQIEKNFFICPEKEHGLNGIFLVNHSCEPNCAIYDKNKLIAKRDIKPDEEISIDYSFVDAEFEGMDCKPFEKFDCLCGTPNCRGIIAGTDWKKEELQTKFQGWFSGFIQEMINELRANKTDTVEAQEKTYRMS